MFDINLINWGQIYTILTTIGTIIGAYLWVRKTEIEKLAWDVIKANADKKLTREEFNIIVNDLADVIYKPAPQDPAALQTAEVPK